MPRRIRAPALVLAAMAATSAPAEELLLDRAGGHVVEAVVGGVPLRLRVALDAHGFVILNQAAAQRARLGRGDGRAAMSIGPVRLRGRVARRPVTIGAVTQVLPLHWYEAPVDPFADGVISPGLLPYDLIRLRYGGAGVGRELRFLVQLGENDGLHVPVDVGGGYSIAVRFAPTEPHTVAAGAAAAMMAEAHGGMLYPDPVRIEIGFGVRRPAQWLTLARPVRVGALGISRLLMRTGDFLGHHALPSSLPDVANGEIVVTASGDRQAPLYRMTIGSDVLGHCGEADYRRADRSVTLRC